MIMQMQYMLAPGLPRVLPFPFSFSLFDDSNKITSGNRETEGKLNTGSKKEARDTRELSVKFLERYYHFKSGGRLCWG